MPEVIFWMNMPSFYQSDLFRALAKTGGVDLKVYFSDRVPDERLKLGWQDDLSGFDHEFLDGRHKVADAFRKALRHRHSIHVVGGLWAGRMQEVVLATLFVSGSRYFIYSEAPDPRTVPSRLKAEILTALGKPIVKKASGIFAISHFAGDYFRSFGIDDAKIRPFGYFRSFPAGFEKRGPEEKRSGIEVVFVGQLVRRKGVDLLLSALEPLFGVYNDLRLRLIGSGESEGQFRTWMEQRRLSSRVFFEGAVGSAAVMDMISRYHVLVLPSRWDGWGIVVNEALMAGVPVIVSDMCGAADVVRDGVNGYVFHSENVEDLRIKLKTLVGDAGARKALSAGASFTGGGLDAENGARYLLHVLSGRESKVEDVRRYPWIF